MVTLHQHDPIIKEFLDHTYNKFHSSEFLAKDPLILAHECRNEPYFIPLALGAALFAYGRVDQILKLGRNLQESMHDFYYSGKLHVPYLYRLQTAVDVSEFIKSSFVLIEYESKILSLLKTINDPLVLISYIQGVLRENCTHLSPGFKFLIGTDSPDSARKRYMMFLRWMVRKDALDFGVWSDFPKSNLIFPLDTHISKLGGELFPNIPKSNNILRALAITNEIKNYSPDDPLKFDFSLCHSGMESKKLKSEI